MTVTGRVLGPDGQPAAGVPVDLIAAPRDAMAGLDDEREPFLVLGQGATDADGRFRIDAIRSSSSRFSGVYALAGAIGPGSAVGCVELNADAEQPTAEIHLQPEQVLRGKLVDVNGQPAAGVAVQVDTLYGSPARSGTRFDSPDLGPTSILSAWPEGLRAWPRPVTTDAQGRFTLNGIGRGLSVWLSVHDPRFAQHRFDLPGRDRDAGKEVSLALHPSTIIEGRVLAADTGQPIPDATDRRAGRLRHVRRPVHDEVPHRRPGAVPGQPVLGRLLPPAGLPPQGPGLPARGRRIRVDQGRRPEGDRHRGPPRRADPRQGDRAGDRPAGGPAPASTSSRWGSPGACSTSPRSPGRTAHSGSPSRPARAS